MVPSSMSSTVAVNAHLAALTAEVAKDLENVTKRAELLHRYTLSLQDKKRSDTSDKAVQAEIGTTAHPIHRLNRLIRQQPFSFLPRNKKLNWKKLRTMNLEKLERDGDTRTIMELFNDVAYANLDGESVFNMSEANLIKLVRLSQYMLQYLQYRIEQYHELQERLEEEHVQLTAGLALMPTALGLEDVEEGLLNLEDNFYSVADQDLDRLFTQTRIEEREFARGTLANTVHEKKLEVMAAMDAQVKEIEKQKR